MILALALLLDGQLPPIPHKSLPVAESLSATAAVSPAPTKDLGALWLQNQLLAREVNAARAAHGLHPLAIDNRLAAAAWDQGRDCFLMGSLSHRGLDGSWPWDRMARYGFPCRAAGENATQTLERGGSVLPPDPALIALSARQAVSDWMTADPWHRANVLGDWTVMGCAAVPATGRYAAVGGTFWVVDFAR